ncbi:uncharacterized protein LOC115539279 isoform X2 [Gadus morhua]|uniref:uncharacterized protein LOC115539279 isoform X2 n=1 Tax=Gadus morhua TaxID=8049 RepID=UPI0011B82855|nr:uncharacterized protein LOC115539279 isoform X2 [Gadus morhua]
MMVTSVLSCVVYHFIALFYRWLKLERDLTELEKQIDEMETPDQVNACYALWERLEEKKKTPKQEMKFDELIDRHNEKYETMDLNHEIIEGVYRRRLMETEGANRRLNVWIDLFLEQMKSRELDRELTELANQICLKKTVKQEQDGEFYKLIDQLLKKVKKERKRESAGGAAGEGTARYTSTNLPSTELPAGLETSIPPAPSSETQPAGLETSIPPAPSSETQPAGLETSIPPAPSSETQPAEGELC